jgi:hypothetical protein
VNGWTLVIGLPLPYPVGRSFLDKCTPMLLDLGMQFNEVQYYFTYPLIDTYAWARIVDGTLLRSFAIGAEGAIWNKGKPTKEEKSLGLKLFELRGVYESHGHAGGEPNPHPSEQHVLRLAGRWSLDPTRLGGAAPAALGTGYVCAAPIAWRPERLRKSVPIAVDGRAPVVVEKPGTVALLPVG